MPPKLGYVIVFVADIYRDAFGFRSSAHPTGANL
jgi:hypothetical protein